MGWNQEIRKARARLDRSRRKKHKGGGGGNWPGGTTPPEEPPPDPVEELAWSALSSEFGFMEL